MLDLSVHALQLQSLFYEECSDFYSIENQRLSRWITTLRLSSDSSTAILPFASQSHLPLRTPPALLLPPSFSTGSLQSLDILSILQNFSQKVLFDSIEVKTLNTNEALVISKDNLRSHLHGINLDLIDLIEEKYSKAMRAMEQKCDVLSKDVIFQKQLNRLSSQKIAFLETNILNIVEAQVAQKSNELVYEIQRLQKLAEYTADERQLDYIKIHADIVKSFEERCKENQLQNDATLSRFYDFRQGQKLEVFNLVEGIKEHNIKRLKEEMTKVLEEHGGASTAHHLIDGIWATHLEDRREDVEETKKKPIGGANNGGGGGGITSRQINHQSTFRMNPTVELPEESPNHQLQKDNPLTTIEPSEAVFPAASMASGAFSESVFDRIEFQNKEVVKLKNSFNLLRAFFNMKAACAIQKYESEISRIHANNSSNEQLYRDKKEMQAQTESMKDQLLAMKKTMAIMEYQNEILRRDVQRSRIDRIKAIKAMKEKDDKLRQAEERLESTKKDKVIATMNNINFTNSHTILSRNFSAHQIKKKQKNEQLANSLTVTDTSLQVSAALILNTPAAAQNNHRKVFRSPTDQQAIFFSPITADYSNNTRPPPPLDSSSSNDQPANIISSNIKHLSITQPSIKQYKPTIAAILS